VFDGLHLILLAQTPAPKTKVVVKPAMLPDVGLLAAGDHIPPALPCDAIPQVSLAEVILPARLQFLLVVINDGSIAHIVQSSIPVRPLGCVDIASTSPTADSLLRQFGCRKNVRADQKLGIARGIFGER